MNEQTVAIVALGKLERWSDRVVTQKPNLINIGIIRDHENHTYILGLKYRNNIMGMARTVAGHKPKPSLTCVSNRFLMKVRNENDGRIETSTPIHQIWNPSSAKSLPQFGHLSANS